MGNKNALERYYHIDYCLYHDIHTLKEIVEYVNLQLTKDGLEPVSLRTVRKDICYIETIFSRFVVKERWLYDNKYHYFYDHGEKCIFTDNQ